MTTTATHKEWLTKSQLCERLKIGRSRLEMSYPLFKQGTHYRLKNPSNPRSQRLWDLVKVEKTLLQPHKNALRQMA
tara:strand:+ start:2883 stop:3110 length:228 start_codon:yes stop_codon:yes gene_type:complete